MLIYFSYTGPVIHNYGSTVHAASETSGVFALDSTLTYMLRDSKVKEAGFLARARVGTTSSFSITIVVSKM